MKNNEERIYDAITDSAKRKFDYLSFKSSFPTDNEHQEIISDKIVWKIINSFQAKKSKNAITDEIYTDLIAMNFKPDRLWLSDFINDKDVVFKSEIAISILATDMLNQGLDPDVVYLVFIKQLL